jgi:hypothetical protein
VANKGIRCSALVADLTARRDAASGTEAGALIDELLRKGGNR